MSSSGVDYSGVTGPWARADFAERWLLLPGVLRCDSEALLAACAVADAALGQVHGMEGHPSSDPLVNTPNGVVVHHTGAGDAEAAERWLAAFAAHLEGRGVSGRLATARSDFGPAWSTPWALPDQLAAFVSYRRSASALADDRQRLIRSWAVDPELTKRICMLAAGWVSIPGARLLFRQETFSTRAQPDDLGTAFTRSTLSNHMGGLTSTATKPNRVRSAQVEGAGLVIYTLLDDRVSWETRLSELRAIMVHAADDTDLALARYSQSGSITWGMIGHGPNPDHHRPIRSSSLPTRRYIARSRPMPTACSS